MSASIPAQLAQIRGAGKARAALLPLQGQPLPFWNMSLRATARGFRGEMKPREMPIAQYSTANAGGRVSLPSPRLPSRAWTMLPPLLTRGFPPKTVPCKSERLGSSFSKKAGNSQSESRTLRPQLEAVHLYLVCFQVGYLWQMPFRSWGNHTCMDDHPYELFHAPVRTSNHGTQRDWGTEGLFGCL